MNRWFRIGFLFKLCLRGLMKRRRRRRQHHAIPVIFLFSLSIHQNEIQFREIIYHFQAPFNYTIFQLRFNKLSKKCKYSYCICPSNWNDSAAVTWHVVVRNFTPISKAFNHKCIFESAFKTGTYLQINKVTSSMQHVYNSTLNNFTQMKTFCQSEKIKSSYTRNSSKHF